MSVTTVRLARDVEEQLETLEERLQRSRSWIINQAVREYIVQAQREQQRWEETLAAMESAAKGRVVDGEAVHDWLRGWGTENEKKAPRKRR